MSTLGKVVAIAREEGSGTRAELDTILSTNEAAADAVVASTIDVLQQVGQEEECHRLSCSQHAATGAGAGVYAAESACAGVSGGYGLL